MLASLFIIWFGLGLSSKVATAVVLVFFAVFFNAFQGAREVDRNLVDNARILGASRTQVLTSIVVPSATSWIFAVAARRIRFRADRRGRRRVRRRRKGLGLLISNAQGTFDAAGHLRRNDHHHRGRPARRMAASTLPKAGCSGGARRRPIRDIRCDHEICKSPHRAAGRCSASLLRGHRLPRLQPRDLPMANGRPQINIMVGGLDKVIYLPAMLTEQLGYFEAQRHRRHSARPSRPAPPPRTR